MGAAVGFGGTVWAQRRVKRRVVRFLPDRMSADVVQRARYLAEDVRIALDEGREAMRAREEELRRQLGAPGAARASAELGRPRLSAGDTGFSATEPGFSAGEPRLSAGEPRLSAGEPRLSATEPGRHRSRHRSRSRSRPRRRGG
jgi:hypothetical protein